MEVAFNLIIINIIDAILKQVMAKGMKKNAVKAGKRRKLVKNLSKSDRYVYSEDTHDRRTDCVSDLAKELGTKFSDLSDDEVVARDNKANMKSHWNKMKAAEKGDPLYEQRQKRLERMRAVSAARKAEKLAKA